MTFFKPQYKNKTRVLAGKTAKSAGVTFEIMFERECAKNQVICVRMPDGCRVRTGPQGRPVLTRVQTPFDFFFTKNGKSSCIDCKSKESGNFAYSDLTMHQVMSLQKISKSINSGYVVFFRDKDKVVFFSAEKLNLLKRRESLSADDGLLLGDSDDFNPEFIFY